ncbi:MAG: adenylosuccinate lyase [Bdellovibrionales bacterium]|nr:adenylosuccinate lyase [Bdellovibrionales bacterium]
MINRYEVPAIAEIWSEKERWNRLFKVEMALLESLEETHWVPAGCVAAFKNVKIDPVRIRELEKNTRHDVVAFCSSVTEQVESKYSRFFHYGVTSSDILDTALSLQIRESLQAVAFETGAVIKSLESIINRTSGLLSLGRSHGMAAEPMIFAQKFFSFQMELWRRLGDVEALIEHEITGQFSGSVGNYSILTPEVENLALARLGLRAEPVSSQVIPRDRIAKIVSIGSLLACSIERIATEIRHLSRSEVGEVLEEFSDSQTGSSTMPHKRNPVSSENLCGLARVIRSHLVPTQENTVLWHERDISHSSVERLILPDHFGLLVYSLQRLNQTLSNLRINQDRISENLRRTPGVFSSLILHSLLEQNTCSREVIYRLVQSAALGSVTLQEMTEKIRKSATDLGLHAQIEDLSLESLCELYRQRFIEIRDRARAVSE